MRTIPYRSWRGRTTSQRSVRHALGGALLFLVLVNVCMLACPIPLAHASPGAISQDYATNDKNISQGALVSLVSKGGTFVTLANDSNNALTLIGVAASKPLIELSHGSANGVQVVVGGSTDVLVTDLNGQINAGDKITASPISGIGMKATNPTEIVGTAQVNLSSISTITGHFVGTNGKAVTAKVGLLPIAVNVTYYAAISASSSVSAYVPPFLQNFANAVAGRSVSPLRVLIGVIALLLGFATIMVMLYTGIRSGVISLGRNPLAADALRSGMIDILLTAVGILAVTGAAVAAVIIT